jgi:hypothetical protein
MVIRVSDGSNLLDLLWLRHHAIGNAEPALPPAALPGEPLSSADPVLVGTWERMWKQTLDHVRLVQEADPRLISERSDLWTLPNSSALTDGLDRDVSTGVSLWRERLSAAPSAEMAVTESVRRAWERGLRVVVELPLGAPYATKLSTASLVVSAPTRRDSVRYSEALRRF